MPKNRTSEPVSIMPVGRRAFPIVTRNRSGDGSLSRARVRRAAPHVGPAFGVVRGPAQLASDLIPLHEGSANGALPRLGIANLLDLDPVVGRRRLLREQRE